MAKSSLHPTAQQEIEAMLAKKYEGMVLASVYMMHMGGQFSLHRDYYHVRDGIIYLLETNGPYPSGDTFFQLQLECFVVGKFNPRYKYRSSVRHYTYKQIKRLL